MSFVIFGVKFTPGKWEDDRYHTLLKAVQFIAWCFGMGLCINIYAFYRYTGGVFNPAVAFSLFAIGAMSWTKFVMYVIAEMLGASVGAAFVRWLYPADALGNRILGVNNVASGVAIYQAVGLEAFGTFLLCFVVLMLAAERNHSRPLAPLIIGITVYICHLLLIPYTGCSINPARSFGAAMAAQNWTYQWIWWVGPLIGSCMAVAMFAFAKAWDYAALNGAQDEDETVQRILEAQEKLKAGATIPAALEFGEGELRTGEAYRHGVPASASAQTLGEEPVKKAGDMSGATSGPSVNAKAGDMSGTEVGPKVNSTGGDMTGTEVGPKVNATGGDLSAPPANEPAVAAAPADSVTVKVQ